MYVVLSTLQQGISDRFNAFTIDLEVSTQELNVPPQDGNQAPVDFSNFPIVSAIGAQTLQVSFIIRCMGIWLQFSQES